MDEILFTPALQRDERRIAEAGETCVKELAYFETALRADHLAGEFSAADLCLYPSLALLGRIESLPYFDKTYPPHWREASKV